LNAIAAANPCQLLRFLTAGSVDDGKSTLIGRLLHDSGAVYEDELASLVKISAAKGAAFDPSLVTDGLKAEREQGITIDVAYRYFSTPRRQFIIADVPGHEQYTRNMVTGASTADAAVVLIDARKGVLSQTCRHTYIAWLLGIRDIIVAMNKMDAVGFDANVFERIRDSFRSFAAALHLDQLHFIPMSALNGDNVISRSQRTPWYQGLPLLETLESVHVQDDQVRRSFRFPVQTVIRAHQDFRGYAGQVASGKVRKNEQVLVLPSQTRATVASIANHMCERHDAFAPMSVVVSLKEHIDLGRGDMICGIENPPQLTKRFNAQLIWMSSTSLRLNEPYLIKHTTQTACMTVVRLRHKMDVHSLDKLPAQTLQLNEIGEAEIETHKPVFCDAYADNRSTGSFIVIDPVHNTTLAAGIITEPGSRERTEALGPAPFSYSSGEGRGLTIWLTGLSGAGKTTISEAVYTELLALGIRAEILDGDIVRKHLSRELGFSRAERDENIRRIGFVAQLLTRNGVVALVSAISPYRGVREEVRSMVGNFVEVFVNAPLNVCEKRDPKGLYKKARAGEISGFTGVDDPYEPPLSPEIECRTDLENIKESVDKVVSAILKKRFTAKS
jgi:bifunctional enzyme CysN/CysC